MRYLGIDLGSKTIGLSLSDETLTIATAYKTIFFDDEDYASTIAEIKKVLEDELKEYESYKKKSEKLILKSKLSDKSLKLSLIFNISFLEKPIKVIIRLSS